MRRLRELNQYRDKSWGSNSGKEMGDIGGCFLLPFPANPTVRLACIASIGEGWDHVSVSLNLPRTPSWAEMEHVKRTFFLSHEVAMQLHVATDDHISIHPHVLHLWRPHDQPIPLPPKEFV